jgi:hypothetical protein
MRQTVLQETASLIGSTSQPHQTPRAIAIRTIVQPAKGGSANYSQCGRHRNLHG